MQFLFFLKKKMVHITMQLPVSIDIHDTVLSEIYYYDVLNLYAM